MPSLVCTMPDGMIFLLGSPSGRSTLITSAPYSARAAAAVGTNPCSATSITRMPSSGRLVAGILASSQLKYLSNLASSRAVRQALAEGGGGPRRQQPSFGGKGCYFLYDY